MYRMPREGGPRPAGKPAAGKGKGKAGKAFKDTAKVVEEPISPDSEGPRERVNSLVPSDLLEEIAEGEIHEHHMGGGYETPSEPGTPDMRERHHGGPTYWNHGEDIMHPDQWDWKTDAPEFVPGTLKMAVSEAPAFTTSWVGNEGSDGRGALQSQFEWQLQSKADELREMQARLNQFEMETAQVRASWEMERRNLLRQITTYRSVLERYCIPVEEAAGASYKSAAEESIREFHPEPENTSTPWCSEQEQASFGFNSQAGGGAGGEGCGANACGACGGGCSGCGGCAGCGGCGGCSGGCGGGCSGGCAGGRGCGCGGCGGCGCGGCGGCCGGMGGCGGCCTGNEDLDTAASLDSKMRQLNSLLQAQGKGRRQDDEGKSRDGDGQEAIASTLRAMFPHATIRTGRDDAVDEKGADASGYSVEPDVPLAIHCSRAELEALTVDEHTRRLERLTNSTVDERAMRALLGLSTKDAKEALTKVDELIELQEGHCRNLSSILQSVCRKIEKRAKNPKGEHDGYGHHSEERQNWSESWGEGIPDRPDRPERHHAGSRARKGDEDVDAFESEGSDRNAETSRKTPTGPAGPLARSVSQTSQSQNALDTPMGKKSWADMGSDHEDEREKEEFVPVAKPKEEWTPRRVEQVARKGFELKRKGDRWELKISMAKLDPPPTDAGMERYCQWLRVRLKAFREEHGVEPLRRCRGEVDFSGNGMTNQMIWMLLETLAQHQVHTAQLKLNSNSISQGGALAICEFIRTNDQAEAIQELDLSHNEIDDEAANELLKTFAEQRARLPKSDAAKVQVRVHLAQNSIKDADAARKTAEAEGVLLCDV